MKKRLISALLAFSMVLSLFPASAFAAAPLAGDAPLPAKVQDEGIGEESSETIHVKQVSDETGFLNAVAEANTNGGSYDIVLNSDIQLTQAVVLNNSTAIVTITNGDSNAANRKLSPDAGFTATALISVSEGASLTLDHVDLSCNETIGGTDYPLIRAGSGARLTLRDCTLDGGSTESTGSCRGLNLSGDDTIVTLTDSHIQNFRTKNHGGAGIAAYDDSALEMSNSRIENCFNGSSMDGGGGVILYNTAKLQMQNNSTISGCSSKKDGGGVYLSGTGKLTMNSSTIENCRSSEASGGGVYLNGQTASMEMTNSQITGCTAASNGGGVLLQGGSSSLTMTSSTIEGSTGTDAQNGGGVYINGGNAVLTMNNSSTITSCGASENGGGIYLNGAAAKANVNNSSITSCEAKNGGGAYLGGSSSSLNMDGSSITNCTANTGNGGGAYLKNSSLLTSINKGQITDCTAVRGGGIYLSSGGSDLKTPSQQNSIDITITDCSATSSGGGLYIGSHTCSLDLYDAKIYNNEVNSSGADLYLVTGRYNVTLPAVSGKGLVHKTDHQVIDGWYPDHASSRYTPASHVDRINKNATAELTISLMDRSLLSNNACGLIACSVVYDIEFNVSDSEQENYHAYSDSACTTEITAAVPGETVYLKYSGADSTDTERTGWSAVTDGADSYSVPVSHTDEPASFVMPGTRIESKVTITPAMEYKITVNDGTAYDPYDHEIAYAKPGDTFYLKHTGTGTFQRWEWADAKAPDAPDEDEMNKAEKARFTMPERAVEASAVADHTPYTITVVLPEGVDFKQNAEPAAVTVAGASASEAEANQTVSLKFDPNTLPDDSQLTFGSWTVTKAGEAQEAVSVADPSSYNASFTMPASDVIVTFTLTGADTPDVPSDGGGSGDGGGAGVVIGVIAAGAAGYLIGTDIWLKGLFGFIPKTRIELALALWNKADCPEPQNTELYPDVEEDDTSAQKAARWCVEQDLLDDYPEKHDDGTETVYFRPFQHVFRPEAISAWYKLEKLLEEQRKAEEAAAAEAQAAAEAEAPAEAASSPEV